MPYANPQDKKEWSQRWRKQSIKNGYGKWLYQRRAARYADADFFREALEKIAADYDRSDSVELAQRALKASAKRWDALGPAPETHVGKKRMKPASTADDNLLQALARLGLE